MVMFNSTAPLKTIKNRPRPRTTSLEQFPIEMIVPFDYVINNENALIPKILKKQ